MSLNNEFPNYIEVKKEFKKIREKQLVSAHFLGNFQIFVASCWECHLIFRKSRFTLAAPR